VKRHVLGLWPTPLQRLTALEAVLRCGPLYLKRDDLTGFGLAGNKTRACEYLVGDAVASGADVLVTAGAPGSNFVGAAALAARVAGLDCEVLVSGTVPDRLPVTLELARRAGATLRFPGADREELDELVSARADTLRAAGRVPYPVPRGGATAVGALGFAAAAAELADQLSGIDSRPSTPGQMSTGGRSTGGRSTDDRSTGALSTDDVVVVMPTGSGASLAGFLAGRSMVGARWPTYGVSVSRPTAELGPHVLDLAGRCAALLGAAPPDAADVRLTDAIGRGFGRVTEDDRRNVLLGLRTEGLLFDSTYGAKAITAVLGLVRPGQALVLWHTGGLPSALKLLAEPGTDR
jgi:D-cysteine desulfhydrase